MHTCGSTELFASYQPHPLHAQSTQRATQPDDLIDFQLLKARKGMSQLELEDEVTTGESAGLESNLVS